MIGTQLRFGNGFEWGRVAWSPSAAKGPRRLCSYCHGLLDEVPLMLFHPDGRAAGFCDGCTDRYVVGATWGEKR